MAGDMRRLGLPGPFSAILIPGNSLLHLLTGEALERCFACSRRHLLPGGRLVFDVSNPEVWLGKHRFRRTLPAVARDRRPRRTRSASRKLRPTMPAPRSCAWSGTFRSRTRRISGWWITNCARSFRRNCRGGSKPPDSAWKSVTVNSRANLSNLRARARFVSVLAWGIGLVCAGRSDSNPQFARTSC